MTRRQENEFLKRMEAAKSNNIIVPEKMTLSSEIRGVYPSIIAYERIYGEEKMLVVCNFYKTEVVWDSGMDLKGFETLLGNYSEQKIEESKISLKPYEAMMLYRKR